MTKPKHISEQRWLEHLDWMQVMEETPLTGEAGESQRVAESKAAELKRQHQRLTPAQSRLL